MPTLPAWRLALAFLASLALLVPAATAGSEASPEVTDGEGDGSLCIGECTPSQEFLDLLKAWVDVPDPTHVAFHLQVGGAAPASGVGVGVGVPDPLGFCPSIEGSVIYTLHFQTQDAAGAPLFPTEPDGNEVTDEYLVATRPCDTAEAGPDALDWGFYLAYTFEGATGAAITQVPVSGSLAGDQFTWILERSAVGVALPEGAAAGHKVANLAATSGLYLSAGIVSDSADFVADLAPDSGTGLPFTFSGQGSGGVRPIYANVTAPKLEVVARLATSTNQTFVYNWTNAEAGLDVAFGAAVRSGTARVVVKDSANATVLDKTFPGAANGTLQLSGAKAGKWQATVTYANFTGDLRLSIAKREAPAPGTTTTSSTGPATTTGPVTNSGTTIPASATTAKPGGGASSSSTSKGTPALGLAVLAALVGGGAAVRRRLAR